MLFKADLNPELAKAIAHAPRAAATLVVANLDRLARNVAFTVAIQTVVRKSLKPWIDGFAFQCEYAKNALVNSSQWFLPYKPFKSFDAEGELSDCE